jgi:competence protein ComFC
MCSECSCTLPFRHVTVVGERKKLLKRLVGNFKYFSQRESAKHISHLLGASLPDNLPKDISIVPIPTAPKHIRERGFDHMKLVAKHLAKDLDRKTMFCLKRLNNDSQHNVSASKRREQAELSFAFDKRKTPPKTVILVDDIYTTGATVGAAAKILKDNGVKEVWLAIFARQ